MSNYYRILNHTKKEYINLEPLRVLGNSVSGAFSSEKLLASWPYLLLSEPKMHFFQHEFHVDEEEYDLLRPDVEEEATDILVADFDWLEEDIVVLARLTTPLDLGVERRANACQRQ